MGQGKLIDKKVFVFDAFGTLFRTAPIGKELTGLVGDSADDLLDIWRRKQLEYTWLRNQMGQYVSFDVVTKEALTYAMHAVGLQEIRVFDLLLPIYDTPTLIEGAMDLFESLSQRGKFIYILSNGTLKMLENGISKTGVSSMIETIISVDEIGVYKPDPRVYQLALEKIGLDTEAITFFSSNQWDVSGASNFGLDCVWVNQHDETKEVLPFANVLEVKSLLQVSTYF